MPWPTGQIDEASDEGVITSVIASRGWQPPAMRTLHDDLVIESATAIADLARRERAEAVASASVEVLYDAIDPDDEVSEFSRKALKTAGRGGVQGSPKRYHTGKPEQGCCSVG